MVVGDGVRVEVDGLAAGGALQFLEIIAAAVAVVVLAAVAVVALLLERAEVVVQFLNVFAERRKSRTESEMSSSRSMMPANSLPSRELTSYSIPLISPFR